MTHLSNQFTYYNNFIQPIQFYVNPFLQCAYTHNYFVPANYTPYYTCIPEISEQKSSEDHEKNISTNLKSDEECQKINKKEVDVCDGSKVSKVDRTFSKIKSQKKLNIKIEDGECSIIGRSTKKLESLLTNEKEQRIFFSKSKKIYKQNPCRNIVTNIGNQLITYICTIKKSRNQLIKIIPGMKQQSIKEFYEYVWKLKKQHDYYLNFSKINDFWFKQDSQEDIKFKKIIRILSNYFLRWILPFSILTSKKMSRDSREFHLKSRKQLLKRLKTNN